VHILDDGVLERYRGPLVGCVLIISLLEFGRGSFEREEREEVVNDVVLEYLY
jgi:hypothetical protein